MAYSNVFLAFVPAAALRGEWESDPPQKENQLSQLTQQVHNYSVTHLKSTADRAELENSYKAFLLGKLHLSPDDATKWTNKLRGIEDKKIELRPDGRGWESIEDLVKGEQENVSVLLSYEGQQVCTSKKALESLASLKPRPPLEELFKKTEIQFEEGKLSLTGIINTC